MSLMKVRIAKLESALRELIEADEDVEQTAGLLIGSLNRWAAEDRKKAALEAATVLLAEPSEETNRERRATP